jgi:tripartite-type tricarboxylate transporter receptor subunit TctC
MNITRRLGLVFVACAFVAPAQVAFAEDYPTRPITLVVPYGAGGTTDVSARQLASMAEKVIGQPIVVENQPGGSGTNAMRAVAAADADGYTLIATTSSPSFVTPALRPVGYNPLEDFTPILNYSGPYHGVVVRSDSPFQSLDDLIAVGKSGTTVTYGTAGAMGGAHLTFTAVAKETGAKLQHVPFDGASAATAAVLGGHADAALVPAYRDLVRDGQLRLLAVLDGARDPDFPDVPTLKDAGYQAEFPSIVGILAPAGIDEAVEAKLEKVFTETASSDEFKDFMTKLSQPVRIMSGDELGETIANNFASYKELAAQLMKAQ